MALWIFTFWCFLFFSRCPFFCCFFSLPFYYFSCSLSLFMPSSLYIFLSLFLSLSLSLPPSLFSLSLPTWREKCSRLAPVAISLSLSLSRSLILISTSWLFILILVTLTARNKKKTFFFQKYSYSKPSKTQSCVRVIQMSCLLCINSTHIFQAFINSN